VSIGEKDKSRGTTGAGAFILKTTAQPHIPGDSRMKNIFTASIAVFVGFIAVAAGLREFVLLADFWWGVRHSLEIFLGDIPFVSWIVLQTLVYAALTVSGVGVILMRRWARVPGFVLLCTDALFKIVAPPVTRTDAALAAASFIAAGILLAVPGMKAVFRRG